MLEIIRITIITLDDLLRLARSTINSAVEPYDREVQNAFYSEPLRKIV